MSNEEAYLKKKERFSSSREARNEDPRRNENMNT